MLSKSFILDVVLPEVERLIMLADTVRSIFPPGTSDSDIVDAIKAAEAAKADEAAKSARFADAIKAAKAAETAETAK
jgi:hypothetical protein